MSRESEAERRNKATVLAAWRRVLKARPELKDAPGLRGHVVQELRCSDPAAVTYMERHCGGAIVEVTAIISNERGLHGDD